MCTRDPADVPEHDVYVCGFPCQPFSRLHNKRTHFKEAKAAPFKAMLRMLRKRQPKLVVLENVPGILDVQDRLMRALRSLKIYRPLMLRLDPTMFGDPVRRPRVYILLTRLDSLVHASGADGRAVTESVMSAIAIKTMRKLTNMLASAGAGVPPRLPSCVSARKRSAVCAGVSAHDGSAAKWRKLHSTIRASLAQGPRDSFLAASMVGLTPRERDGLDITLRQDPDATAVDVSQSAGRMPVASGEGPLPTMTPGARVVLVKARRLLSGADKVSLAAFPMRELQLPATLTERDLHTLGGNTMHVKCVAAALLVGLLLVSSGTGALARRQRERMPIVGDWPRSARSTHAVGVGRG
jgi:site-specific DNA-cytosine methylase